MVHKSVLLQESIGGLDIKAGEIFVDATLGNGGHSEKICELFGSSVKILGMDADSEALERSEKRLAEKNCDFKTVLSNFRDLDKALDSAGISKPDKILFDLGLSSNQLEDSGRGFTFQKDEPLLMSFKKDIGDEDLTAEKIVNGWPEEDIASVLWEYGEERYSRRIAKAIVEARKKEKITTTFRLAEVVLGAVPASYRNGRINPATRTFQALRIAVNDEMESLKEGLAKGFERLSSGGRMAVISFHSLEDRIVKNYFRDLKKDGLAEVLTKKPIVAGDEEVLENPRARSAKLRIVSKI